MQTNPSGSVASDKPFSWAEMAEEQVRYCIQFDWNALTVDEIKILLFGIDPCSFKNHELCRHDKHAFKKMIAPLPPLCFPPVAPGQGGSSRESSEEAQVEGKQRPGFPTAGRHNSTG